MLWNEIRPLVHSINTSMLYLKISTISEFDALAEVDFIILGLCVLAAGEVFTVAANTPTVTSASGTIIHLML